MPTVQKKVSIAASSVNDNLLSGSQFEFLPYNAQLLFGLQASAAGLVADVYSGQDTIAESFELPTQNRYPVFPDDFTLDDIAAAGERLKVRIRNTTAVALDAFLSLRITPV